MMKRSKQISSFREEGSMAERLSKADTVEGSF
jgi:hypothetical protein